MPSLSLGQWAQVAVYILLCVLWAGAFAYTYSSLSPQNIQGAIALHAPTRRALRKARNAFLLISAILFIDSFYWAIVRISQVQLINKDVGDLMVAPGVVALVKGLVLLSCAVYLWVVAALRTNFLSYLGDLYFSNLIDQMFDAVGILAPDGKMLVWNKSAEHLFGFSREEVLGRHINEFLVPEDQKTETWRQLHDAKITRQAARFTQPRKTKSGEIIQVEVVSSPIFGESGIHIGYFGIMRAVVPKQPLSAQQLSHLT